MRVINYSLLVATSLLLVGCGTDHNNDYLNAQQGAALKIPAKASAYALKAHYPVPSGATWHSSQPISIYPPGSSLAKHMQTKVEATDKAVTLGVDAQGSAALNINKPYAQVWQQLPKLLKSLGYRREHSDINIGLYVARSHSIIYQFTLLKSEHGNSILSVRDAHGVALSDSMSVKIMRAIQQELGKIS